jgi:hypothetical protein
MKNLMLMNNWSDEAFNASSPSFLASLQQHYTNQNITGLWSYRIPILSVSNPICFQTYLIKPTWFQTNMILNPSDSECIQYWI